MLLGMGLQRMWLHGLSASDQVKLRARLWELFC
jgi:hypothetical protein